MELNTKSLGYSWISIRLFEIKSPDVLGIPPGTIFINEKNNY